MTDDERKLIENSEEWNPYDGINEQDYYYELLGLQKGDNIKYINTHNRPAISTKLGEIHEFEKHAQNSALDYVQNYNVAEGDSSNYSFMKNGVKNIVKMNNNALDSLALNSGRYAAAHPNSKTGKNPLIIPYGLFIRESNGGQQNGRISDYSDKYQYNSSLIAGHGKGDKYRRTPFGFLNLDDYPKTVASYYLGKANDAGIQALAKHYSDYYGKSVNHYKKYYKKSIGLNSTLDVENHMMNLLDLRRYYTAANNYITQNYDQIRKELDKVTLQQPYFYAFDKFDKGTYNPGQSNYEDTVMQEGTSFTSSPEFKKYWDTRGKHYYQQGLQEGKNYKRKGGKISLETIR